MAWSYPGWRADCTPYGVCTHEMGHHVEYMLTRAPLRASSKLTRPLVSLMRAADPVEKPLTAYCPNASEIFAEMMKLFITNPDLLLHLRPVGYSYMVDVLRLKPLETRDWYDVIKASPRHVREALRLGVPAGAVLLRAQELVTS